MEHFLEHSESQLASNAPTRTDFTGPSCATNSSIFGVGPHAGLWCDDGLTYTLRGYPLRQGALNGRARRKPPARSRATVLEPLGLQRNGALPDRLRDR